MIASILTWAFCLSVCVKADIPSGYILQITPECGSDGLDDGKLRMVTDLNANAHAICMNDAEVNFTTTDNVNFEMPFSFQNSPGQQPCKFIKRKDVYVYAAVVLVSYGEPGSLVHQYTEEYTVTCSFDRGGNETSESHEVDETLIAAHDIEAYANGTSDANVVLCMVDVLGEDLAGATVGLGRTVQLMATFEGAEKCLKPVSCDALDSKNARFSVIRAGCGDGVVFPKDKGFMTNGSTTVSPYFQLFSVNVDPTLRFECNFTLQSTSDCGGSSCVLEKSRRKRGVIAQVIPRRQVLVNAGTKPVILLGTESRGGVASVKHSKSY